MANVITYKNLQIVDQDPTEPAGLMINNNFKILANSIEATQSQINDISGGEIDLTEYTTLTTTSAISSGLQSQINDIDITINIFNSTTSDITSNYTTSITTAAISAGLQSRIDALLILLNSHIGGGPT